MEEENKNKVSNTKGTNKDFPFTTIGVAEEVLHAIDKAGGKIDTKALSESLGIKGGAFARKLSSVKRWGLASGSGMLFVTDLGKGILHPISDEELVQTRKSAFTNIPLFSQLYERFGINLPEDKTFVAILVREYDLKEDDTRTILNIYKNSIKLFLSLVGESKSDKKTDSIKNPREVSESGDEDSDSVQSGLSIVINSSMGKNKFNAKTKEEFQKLRKDLEKIWDAIELFWKKDKSEEQENDEKEK